MKRVRVRHLAAHDGWFHPHDKLCWVRDDEGVWMSCDQGHWSGLGNNSHTIAKNGDVSPSVVCAHKGCTFHEHITLEGWP